MSGLQLIATIGFFLASSAWATPPPAAVTASRDATVAVPPLSKVHLRVEQGQAEVKRLQREVARQESDSNRASQRVLEQDRQIAELRRKLSQLQAKAAAGHP
ncbi:MAG: hypothetical protein ABI178_05790 [Rhodanobacter sp.]